MRDAFDREGVPAIHALVQAVGELVAALCALRLNPSRYDSDVDADMQDSYLTWPRGSFTRSPRPLYPVARRRHMNARTLTRSPMTQPTLRLPTRAADDPQHAKRFDTYAAPTNTEAAVTFLRPPDRTHAT